MAFQYGGASAIGRSHLDRGKACEDAYHIVEEDGGIVACVCDGAGSASRSAEGAASLALNVSMALRSEIGQLHQASAVLALQDAIEDTRRQLQRKARCSTSIPHSAALLCPKTSVWSFISATAL